MDGRVRTSVLAGLAVASLSSVGCHFFQKEPTLPNATLPVAGMTPPAKSGFFSSSPKYGPPTEQVPIRDAAAKGKPFKPETFIAVGDAELEAAFDESRPAADRDQLIDVARQRYDAALQQDPKNKEALLGRAKLYTWAGDRDRAVQMYQEAAKHHPRDKDVAFAMVKCHVRFQDWDRACQACSHSLSLDPENRHFTKSLGYCQARGNRWEEAFGTLMKIMSESEARTFLGQTMMAIGRPEDGMKQLQLAANDPQNETVRTILAQMQAPQQPSAVQQTGFDATAPR